MIWLLSLLLLAGTNPGGPTIIDRPLPLEVSSERRVPMSEVDTVMLHFASDVVANPQDPHDVERVAAIFERYKVSAHYLIDRDGMIYRLVPETRAAWHAGRGTINGQPHKTNRLNHHSIGIEMLAIGTQDEMAQYITADAYAKLDPADLGFTDPQYEALNKLLVDLVDRHEAIHLDREHVIAHSEYSTGTKVDPGNLFDWTRIGLEK
jgi:N-acetyl-anhydromuramyl-L-alanine amidase AmpD